MADDTRQSQAPVREDLSREALTVNPEQKAFTGQQWQRQDTPMVPPENANMLAGGTENTAGGKVPEVNLSNAVSMIKMNEFTELHKKPCNRQSFLTGIGAGFAAGALRSILGGSVWTSCSWSVATFVVGAVGQRQYCLSRRAAEKAGMTRAMEIMNRKELEKRARESHKENMKAERRKAKDEEQDRQLAAMKEKESRRSWKLW